MSLRPKFKASFVEDKQMAPHEEWNGTNSLFSCLLIILLLRDDLIIIIWHNFSKDLDVKPEKADGRKTLFANGARPGAFGLLFRPPTRLRPFFLDQHIRPLLDCARFIPFTHRAFEHLFVRRFFCVFTISMDLLEVAGLVDFDQLWLILEMIEIVFFVRWRFVVFWKFVLS